MAIALGVFAAAVRAWWFVGDDAYISFRYAEALATRGALEFNPGERVEGYTNFLWVVLLAAGIRLGAAPEVLALWLGAAMSLAGLGVAAGLGRRLRGVKGPWTALDLAPALLLAVTPEYGVWATSGLEGGTAATLVLAAILAWLLGHVRSAGVLGALAGLTRPDALLPLGLFGAAWLGLRGFAAWRRGGVGAALRAAPWRRLAVGAALFVGPLAAHLAFRRIYYGAWLPNTWFIKAHGALLRESVGGPYVEAWARGVGMDLLWPLGFLVRGRHLVVALPIAGAAGYVWSVGGDFMAYGRLLVVGTALWGVLAAWLVADAVGLVARRWRPLAALEAVIVVAVAAAVGARARERWETDMGVANGWVEGGRWEGVRAMARFAQQRALVGRWMRENLPEGTWISVGAAGALPYASRLPAIDVYGLTDPQIARLPGLLPRSGPRNRPGHQIYAPLSYVRGRDPDLYCHLGMVTARPPGRATARGRGLGSAGRWACIHIEAAPAPREPGGMLEPFYYCCLRPAGRAVGPFTDAPEGA